jgi:hypothetical protein
MRYIKTTGFCVLIIGILMACCFQHFMDVRERDTIHSDFLSKAYKLEAYKSQQLPATPVNITKVYRKYREKSLQINFHFISDNRFILLEQDPKAFLSWRPDEHIPSSFLLFQGTRAPPVDC